MLIQVSEYVPGWKHASDPKTKVWLGGDLSIVEEGLTALGIKWKYRIRTASDKGKEYIQKCIIAQSEDLIKAGIRTDKNGRYR